MTSPVTEADSALKKLEAYVASEAHRVVAWAITEGVALFTLAHTSSSSLWHEIAVASAAALAAAVNKARANHLIPS